jgi:hypothetical protein
VRVAGRAGLKTLERLPRHGGGGGELALAEVGLAAHRAQVVSEPVA